MPSSSRHHPYATLAEFEQVQQRLYVVPGRLWAVALLMSLLAAAAQPEPPSPRDAREPIGTPAA